MKKLILKHKISALILAIIISAAGFYGCNNNSTSSQGDNVGFSATSSVDSIGNSLNILVLDTVKILIKDIKLNLESNSEDLHDFKVGPFVLFLNLKSGVNFISSAIIPNGSYDKIKFEIHKLENNETVPDPEFAGGYSVIVKGWYLGYYFIYRSTKSAHQILHFPNALSISSVYSNITLVVRPYLWFIKNGSYLVPWDPANENDIDNNIKDNFKNNFKAFKDNDKDGNPD